MHMWCARIIGMADETNPDAAVEEAVVAGMLRENGSNAFKLTIIAAIGGLPIPPSATATAGTIDLSTQWISLHTADPGTTGTPGELNTAGVYKRQRVTWNAPTAITEGGIQKSRITGTVPAFDVPAGTISHYGVWAGGSATGGGTYLYGKPIGPGTGSSVTLSTQGKITITPTHSYGLLAPS